MSRFGPREERVGNLQLTRSMYRQLDEAVPKQFEPFGRVKDNKRKTKEGVLQLVGRDSKTGALVRRTPARLVNAEGTL